MYAITLLVDRGSPIAVCAERRLQPTDGAGSDFDSVACVVPENTAHAAIVATSVLEIKCMSFLTQPSRLLLILGRVAADAKTSAYST